MHNKFTIYSFEKRKQFGHGRKIIIHGREVWKRKSHPRGKNLKIQSSGNPRIGQPDSYHSGEISLSIPHTHDGRFYYSFFGKLNENRVQFTTGRDIVLEPKQEGPPLNYFVYPYVEVDGKPLAKDNIKLKLDFTDRN